MHPKIKFKIFHLLAPIALLFCSCESATDLSVGIQPSFEAVNPAAIIAVPVFLLPDPERESTIDPSIISSAQFINLLQSKIIASFKGQPNINGFPFEIVEKALNLNKTEPPQKSSNVQPSLKSLTILDNLKLSMQTIANRFSSRDIAVRSLITSSCLARKNFLEFYSYCLANDTNWISGLNSLSTKIMNADTALFTIVTNLTSRIINGKYEIEGSIVVLLIDTNNGKLIWGNEDKAILTNPIEKQEFPSWSLLINTIINEKYWEGFPGRLVPQTVPPKL